MHTPGFTWYTAPLPSRASSLLQVHLPTRPASEPSFLWELGCQRCLHRDRCHREQARSYRCACLPTWPANHECCGSWLASDAYTGIAAIASKLAPTGAPAHPPGQRTIITVGAGLPAMLTPGSLTSRASSLLQVHLPTHLASAPSLLWELACQRCLHRHRCHREQARSCRCTCPPARPVNHHYCGFRVASLLWPGR